MSASLRLRAKLELAYPAVAETSARIWGDERVRDLYPAYLTIWHGIVRSAVPLIEAAAARARELAPADEVAAMLVAYFEHHGPEEAGHDVWLLEDLEALGGDRATALQRLPSPRVATLVGAQYYWLRHAHPVSLLGHMGVVEGYSPPEGFADRLQELTGYPREAFRAIRRHERLDVKHKRELYELIDRLPLTGDHERLMGIAGLHTLQAAVEVFEEIHASLVPAKPVPVPARPVPAAREAMSAA
jgi:pyrroloquinoline quinone (PQQ) biosynthesis protein C